MQAFQATRLHGLWRAGHGIDFHPDDSETYRPLDPIASFSFGPAWPLFIRHAAEAKDKGLHPIPVGVVQQSHGDCLFMGGPFQKVFEHMVPSLGQWVQRDGARLPTVEDYRKHKHHVRFSYVSQPRNGDRTAEDWLLLYQRGEVPQDLARYNMTLR